jgi:hypothetical protein
LAVVASASYLLGDAERAGEAAAAALPKLVTQAGGGPAVDVLAALVWARTNAIYAVMGRGGSWPDGWVSEVRDACEVLLLHPAGTEVQALSYVNFMGAVGAWAEQREVLGRALDRFPLSGDLHGRLRALALRDGGAVGLERAYAELPRTQDNEAEVDWFAGLASLVAAEWCVQNKDEDAALASYRRSQELFELSVGVNETFADSAAHYVCLTHSGSARLFAVNGQWESAVASLRAAIEARPASLSSPDGLRHTPLQNAADLRRRLLREGREPMVGDLDALLAEHGLHLPSPSGTTGPPGTGPPGNGVRGG